MKQSGYEITSSVLKEGIGDFLSNIRYKQGLKKAGSLVKKGWHSDNIHKLFAKDKVKALTANKSHALTSYQKGIKAGIRKLTGEPNAYIGR